jgi:hypothetical protein
MSQRRIEVCAPSEWDVVISPELVPLFVLDAAIVAAQRFFSILLDPSSSGPGGTGYPPTRALLDAMRTLRCHIREHRVTAHAFDNDLAEPNATDDDIPPTSRPRAASSDYAPSDTVPALASSLRRDASASYAGITSTNDDAALVLRRVLRGFPRRSTLCLSICLAVADAAG